LNLNRLAQIFGPLVLLVIGMFTAMAVSLLIIITNLQPPQNDVKLLFFFMSLSGSASVIFVYVLYRTGLLASFSSVRWTLLASILLLALLIILNVSLTAQLMFISIHDLTLTIALLIFASIVAVISVYLISNAWIERISMLERTAEQVAQGDFTARLPMQGKDELARFAVIFNRMISSLATLDQERRQVEQTRRDLIAWVSHDLRTPLASARAMNDAMLDGIVSDPETMMRYTETIQRELTHLSTMIDDLFALTQMDAGNFKLIRETISLRDLISDTLMSMRAKATQAGITLEGIVEPGVDTVEIAPDKIQRVIYNLVDNALRHTPAGQRVLLEAHRQHDIVTVSVWNSAVIPQQDIPHLFTSFFRGEQSRAQWKSGERSTGLGLAIVRGFVEAHGGHIEVTSAPQDGTKFTFTLPQKTSI
jgi:signal transduction histidine kinase